MTVPKTFKAAVVPKAGAQHIITDRSLPSLKPGEIAIKINATAINPIDWKMRDYDIFLPGYPAVLGSDAAGEVVAVGSDVSSADFVVGDRVFFQGIIGDYDASTFQQYARMPAALVSRTPRNITDEQAAGILLAAMAGITGFYDTAKGRGLTLPWASGGDRAGRGAAVVIIGGSSSVGQYAIQFARLSGFERIVTNSSPAHAEHLRRLGATVVLPRGAAPEEFAAAIGGDDVPLDFVFDAISIGDTQQVALQIVQAARKRLSKPTAVVTVQPGDFEPEVLALSKDIPEAVLRQVLGIGSSPELRYLSEPFAKHLGGEDGYIAKGLFEPNRPVVVPGGLRGLETALEKNKRGVSGEKVVIRPFEE
ncbi:chaperonin 10-like protein [Xylariales sp. PMI_506]|nr:chaperonin 10-like protein [Xylariales sp. PMI_506]